MMKTLEMVKGQMNNYTTDNYDTVIEYIDQLIEETDMRLEVITLGHAEFILNGQEKQTIDMNQIINELEAALIINDIETAEQKVITIITNLEG